MDILKIAVCDDEPFIRNYLSSLIQKQNYEASVTEYASAEAYLADKADFDILFLDIELGNATDIRAMPPDKAFPHHNPKGAGTVPGTSGGFETAAGTLTAICPGAEPGNATDIRAVPPDKAFPHHNPKGAGTVPGTSGGLEAAAGTLSPGQLAGETPAGLPAPVNPIGGMELARRIRASTGSPQPLIIFVTGHGQYVYDAFNVDAFQYLLKPIDENRFAEVFRRAAGRIEANARRQPKKLVIQYAGTSRVLSPEDIYYMESQGHKIVLHLKDTTLEYYAKLGALEQALEGQFCRIHKGFLVNLAYVEEYSRTEVALTNGEKLNLSKYKYESFVKAYLCFLRTPY